MFTFLLLLTVKLLLFILSTSILIAVSIVTVLPTIGIAIVIALFALRGDLAISFPLISLVPTRAKVERAIWGSMKKTKKNKQNLSNKVKDDNFCYHKVRRAIIICGTIEKS